MLAYFAVIVRGHPRDRVLQLAPDREAGHVPQGLVAAPRSLARRRAGPGDTATPQRARRAGTATTRSRGRRPWPAPRPTARSATAMTDEPRVRDHRRRRPTRR